MKKREIGFLLTSFEHTDLLPDNIQSKISMCYDAANHAHAPYSRFKVGALAELEEGILVIGSNQENIAYPSGLCAERVALFAARAQHPEKKIKRLFLTAIDGDTPLPHPAYPCGACRQVMADIETNQGSKIEVWMAGTEKVEMVESAKLLLPLEFTWQGPH